MPQALWKCNSKFDGGQESKRVNLTDATGDSGVDRVVVTARIYMASDGNLVNTWKINRWFSLLGGFCHIFCHEFLILKSRLWDLNSRLGGCRICVSEIYFSNLLENNKGKKTEVTLSLILRFNLRLGGYSIWSASTSRTIYDQDFGAWAPHSLGATTSTWRTTRRIRR